MTIHIQWTEHHSTIYAKSVDIMGDLTTTGYYLVLNGNVIRLVALVPVHSDYIEDLRTLHIPDMNQDWYHTR